MRRWTEDRRNLNFFSVEFSPILDRFTIMIWCDLPNLELVFGHFRLKIPFILYICQKKLKEPNNYVRINNYLTSTVTPSKNIMLANYELKSLYLAIFFKNVDIDWYWHVLQDGLFFVVNWPKSILGSKTHNICIRKDICFKKNFVHINILLSYVENNNI